MCCIVSGALLKPKPVTEQDLQPVTRTSHAVPCERRALLGRALAAGKQSEMALDRLPELEPVSATHSRSELKQASWLLCRTRRRPTQAHGGSEMRSACRAGNGKPGPQGRHPCRLRAALLLSPDEPSQGERGLVWLASGAGFFPLSPASSRRNSSNSFNLASQSWVSRL